MGFEPTTTDFLTAVTPTPHICIVQGNNGSAIKSARHGQFQETEKTQTTELNIFLSKKTFLRKIIRYYCANGAGTF